VSTRYPVPLSNIRVFTLGGPPRIVIDFGKIFEEQHTVEITPGLVKTWLRSGHPWGPTVAHIITADLARGFRVKVVPAGRTVSARARVSEIAARCGAIVAVNGGFFDTANNGSALGLRIVDGEWLRLPVYHRAAMLVTRSGAVRFAQVGYTARVLLGSSRWLEVTRLNEWLPPGSNALGLITRRWGDSYPIGAATAYREETVAVVVRRGIVQAVCQARQPNQRIEVPVPADGCLLVGTGHDVRAVLKALSPGTPCAVYFRLSPAYPDVVDAVGGGPMLVRGAKPYIPLERERIPAELSGHRQPRTAVGVTADGKLLLVVVDGRQPAFSVGMFYHELAQLLLRFGAVEAMALDGGGSSTLVVNGRVENSPSDGWERPVSDAVVILPRT